MASFVAGRCLYDDWLVIVEVLEISRLAADWFRRHALREEYEQYGDHQKEYDDSRDLEFARVLPHCIEEGSHGLVS